MIKKVALVVGIVGLLTGLALFFKKQIDRAMDYCYKIKNFKIVKLTKDHVILVFNLYFRNQSDLDFAVNGYAFDIFINGKYILTLKSDTKTVLKANDVSVIEGITIDFNPSLKLELADVLKLITFATIDRENFKITLRGYVSVGINFIKIDKLPLNITMSLKELMGDGTEPESVSTCRI